MPTPSLAELFRRAVRPETGFRVRAEAQPGLAEAVRGLVLVRTGPALLALILGYAGLLGLWGRLIRMEGPLFDYLFSHLPAGVDPAELRAGFQGLPALPSWARVLPWLVLLAPVWVLSLWLHDAVWDHLCLWLLRGVRGRRSLGLTLVAEAEALQVGVLGALLALLGDLPWIGCLFSVLLLPVGLYFWIIRGFALAAWHGCPVWKGILATLLHSLLMGLLALALVVAVLVLGQQAMGPT